MIGLARRCLDAGADLVMLESEGVTENVTAWRTDVVARVADGLGLDRVMFEAADPAVFAWYVKTYGPDVNLFVDHSQIVQLECLRSGVWGTQSLWGRVHTYPGGRAEGRARGRARPARKLQPSPGNPSSEKEVSNGDPKATRGGPAKH
jgi:hypothetical protein